ncbi:MAG: sigma-54-dependent Fis family transcriptional regulator, partial [Fibrobacteres bacterium]|nr:sigma-54-dependent Fis family transcriptional regulator [Fibrobacterota bacterium]
QIALLAKTDITVVLEGETGTGKEVAARLIHESSKRKHSPFIKIDCSTIPANLIERELFGHEKGAFTGAVSAREGRFESADGGTLFIDEICNLSLEVQAKMLQAIQDLKITRVGGTASIPIDIRIVAASNKPLKSMIENGTFRTDLYYRLNQYTLTLPPLRERGDDITLLSEYFIDEASQKLNKSVNSISSEALKVLKGHKWPGNVRELRNTFFRAVLMCEKNEISAEHIELTDLSIGSSIQPKKKRHKWQKAEILDAISKSGGNITSAAASLSISRVMLYRIVKKFGINPDELRIV